ncbi:hypothetical protein KIL84_008923 [Mauremys mutica]|uniref:Uncharacterized protein n=1 Tax=Mauremys mutica TaxID=74926 RepID=A0A9D3X8M7_9SAUR|nr:hypothetical protein KIL84_008923 [Mauremys mutica]
MPVQLFRRCQLPEKDPPLRVQPCSSRPAHRACMGLRAPSICPPVGRGSSPRGSGKLLCPAMGFPIAPKGFRSTNPTESHRVSCTLGPGSPTGGCWCPRLFLVSRWRCGPRGDELVRIRPPRQARKWPVVGFSLEKGSGKFLKSHDNLLAADTFHGKHQHFWGLVSSGTVKGNAEGWGAVGSAWGSRVEESPHDHWAQ